MIYLKMLQVGFLLGKIRTQTKGEMIYEKEDKSCDYYAFDAVAFRV